MDTIVVCGIIRNAASHILEWLAFHRLVGTDRFVLYDVGSTDGTVGLITRSGFRRYATVIDWRQHGERTSAYAHFFDVHAANFTWAVIVDPGEFLHPLEVDLIHDLLPRYNAFSAVVLRRFDFVTSNYQMRRGNLLTASCIRRSPADAAMEIAVPTLLRIRDLQGIQSVPEAFITANAVCNARAQAMALPARLEQVCDDVLVVNSYLSAVEAAETVLDRQIVRFVPRLRALLHVRLSDTSIQPAPATATPPSHLLLGIGIITYNRCTTLAETLDTVQRRTKHERTVLVVADDGSTDGTLEMLQARQVPTVTGPNMGVAWNKNRALFLLVGVLQCDVVILLEDDAYPSRDHWEIEWMRAAARWGHVNNAAHWVQEHFMSGAGTADDPVLSKQVTAQCSVFSREAVLFGGYFDTRFHLFGHEHVEHTVRLMRLGYGSVPQEHTEIRFRLIDGSIDYHSVSSSITVKEKEEWAEQN